MEMNEKQGPGTMLMTSVDPRSYMETMMIPNIALTDPNVSFEPPVKKDETGGPDVVHSTDVYVPNTDNSTCTSTHTNVGTNTSTSISTSNGTKNNTNTKTSTSTSNSINTNICTSTSTSNSTNVTTHTNIRVSGQLVVLQPVQYPELAVSAVDFPFSRESPAMTLPSVDSKFVIPSHVIVNPPVPTTPTTPATPELMAIQTMIHQQQKCRDAIQNDEKTSLEQRLRISLVQESQIHYHKITTLFRKICLWPNDLKHSFQVLRIQTMEMNERASLEIKQDFIRGDLWVSFSHERCSKFTHADCNQHYRQPSK